MHRGTFSAGAHKAAAVGYEKNKATIYIYCCWTVGSWYSTGSWYSGSAMTDCMIRLKEAL